MFRFREWRVYAASRELRKKVEEEVLSSLPSQEKYALVDQLRRAMNSVILNIAEGSYRQTDKDFRHFLNLSQSSLYEVVSCFDLLRDSNYISEEVHKSFLLQCEELARQISAFSKKLQNN